MAKHVARFHVARFLKARLDIFGTEIAMQRSNKLDLGSLVNHINFRYEKHWNGAIRRFPACMNSFHSTYFRGLGARDKLGATVSPRDVHIMEQYGMAMHERDSDAAS